MLSILDSTLFLLQLFLSYFLYLLFLGEKPRRMSLSPSKKCIPVVVVSGATSGIGLEISKKLCSLGYVVFSGYRKTNDKQNLLSVGEANSKNNGKIIPIKLDVTNSRDISECFALVNDYIDSTQKSLLAGVVCNAGVANLLGLAISNKQFVKESFEINYFGALELAQAFVPLLKTSRGRIIFTGSCASKGFSKAFGVYTSTKAAMRQTSLILNAELKELGIKSVLLEPGVFRTRATENYYSSIDFITKNKNFVGMHSVDGGIEVEEKDKQLKALNRKHLVRTLKNFGLAINLALPPKHVVNHVIFVLQAPFVKSNYSVGWDSYSLAMFSFFPECIGNLIRNAS